MLDRSERMSIGFSNLEVCDDFDKSSFNGVMGQNGVDLGENGRGISESQSLMEFCCQELGKLFLPPH